MVKVWRYRVTRREINGFFVTFEAYSSNLVHVSVSEASEFSVRSVESLKKRIFDLC